MHDPSHPPRRKKAPSFHQKQMRFMAILVIAIATILFGLVFYLVNRWSSGI